MLKPDGSVRICTNLIALNSNVEKEEYPTPVASDLMEKEQGSEYFTIIDLRDGYFQVEIDEGDKQKAVFRIDNELMEWNRMPMRYKNAPGIFRCMMGKLLGDLSDKGVEVYLDGVVIHTKTKDEVKKLVLKVLRGFEENNIIIITKKLQLTKKEVKLLGVKANGTTQKPTEKSRDDILMCPESTDIKSLRWFLGKMNFYSGFIKNTSSIATPVHEKTGKYAKFERFKEMTESFIELNERLNNEVKLNPPDYTK